MSGKWHCGYLDGTGITLKSNEKPLNTLEKRYQGRLPFAIVHSSFFVIFHLRFSTFCVEIQWLSIFLMCYVVFCTENQ